MLEHFSRVQWLG